MSFSLSTPGAAELADVVHALRGWQRHGGPVQLHPGDIGWFWQSGAEILAARVRVWKRQGDIVAAGLLDEPTLLRMAVDPDLVHDTELARQLVTDVSDPRAGVLPRGAVDVEARFGGPFCSVLREEGWEPGEAWTPLTRDLADPVEDPGVRIAVVTADRAATRVEVQRGAFDPSNFTEERWHAMASGPAYADARCLVAHDAEGNPVSIATVWSAGQGSPGLLEPMGVHRDHRGKGHGRAISLASAATLRELGASSAVVSTPASNRRAVATYVSAGFERLPDVRDLHRDA
ncbi:GNAT family N-acetyltransferase [Mariniluteicoccus flavus]